LSNIITFLKRGALHCALQRKVDSRRPVLVAWRLPPLDFDDVAGDVDIAIRPDKLIFT
jgi:hypothetical protein